MEYNTVQIIILLSDEPFTSNKMIQNSLKHINIKKAQNLVFLLGSGFYVICSNSIVFFTLPLLFSLQFELQALVLLTAYHLQHLELVS